MVSAAKYFDVRAYRVTNPALVNHTVAELEAMPQDVLAFIVRIRQRGEIVESQPNLVVRQDDIVAVIARQEVQVERGANIGPEVDVKALLDIPLESVDVVITSKVLIQKNIAELARLEGARGVFLRSPNCAGHEIPISPATTIDRGDVLLLVGAKPEVDRAAKELGYADRPTTSTDMVFVGTGIVLGGLLGLLSITVAGIALTLTASGGALIMGLVFGWLRSVYPFFGRIPEPAIWIFDTVGLCLFIGVVGLSAGPSFVSGLKTTGLSLVLVGWFCRSLASHAGNPLWPLRPENESSYRFRACAGAGSHARPAALQDEARSNVPAIGYTVPYAIGNILLTAWGYSVIALMSIGK